MILRWSKVVLTKRKKHNFVKKSMKIGKKVIRNRCSHLAGVTIWVYMPQKHAKYRSKILALTDAKTLSFLNGYI
ncbi:hypothetical protein PR048_011331 [Dryococelus australis]|uniref:Ribosomal protein L35 n=1 Tax=Dryococelus australis TaxID=614101 RepID=A0ABQ9HL96_9NEOP|nr:hypothetical protein PR048_011331 [Dryococelus australis]